MAVDDAVLQQRRAVLHHPPPRYDTGVLDKYAALFASASRGAVTTR